MTHKTQGEVVEGVEGVEGVGEEGDIGIQVKGEEVVPQVKREAVIPQMDWTAGTMMIEDHHQGGGAVAIQQAPIHVPHYIPYVPPVVIHQTSLDNALRNIKIDKIADIVAGHLGTEQAQHRDFAAQIAGMDPENVQQKREAEDQGTGASSSSNKKPSLRVRRNPTPAPIPTVQPEPAPIIAPAPIVPTDIKEPMDTSKGQIKRKDDTPAPKAKAKAKAKPNVPDTPPPIPPPNENPPNRLIEPKPMAKPKKPEKKPEEKRGVKRKDPEPNTEKKRAKKFEEEYDALMKDVAPHLPKAKPKPKPPAKAITSQPTTKTTKTHLKVNPKTGYVDHGTDMDKSKDKKHWLSKGIGYIRDQLELRGITFDNKRFTKGAGANRITKNDLLKHMFHQLVI